MQARRLLLVVALGLAGCGRIEPPASSSIAPAGGPRAAGTYVINYHGSGDRVLPVDVTENLKADLDLLARGRGYEVRRFTADCRSKGAILPRALCTADYEVAIDGTSFTGRSEQDVGLLSAIGAYSFMPSRDVPAVVEKATKQARSFYNTMISDMRVQDARARSK